MIRHGRRTGPSHYRPAEPAEPTEPGQRERLGVAARVLQTWRTAGTPDRGREGAHSPVRALIPLERSADRRAHIVVLLRQGKPFFGMSAGANCCVRNRQTRFIG